MGGTNKRNFKRALISLKIHLTESGDGVSIKFDTHNLSEGGIFVKSSILWEPDQEFDLSFFLPNSEKEIRVKGIVARSDDKYSIFLPNDEDSSIPGMGIKFLNLSEEDREIIRNYIDSL
ncbi:MAG: PilZ domain-containing protein [bacterium]